jgi:hypothetical protein
MKEFHYSAYGLTFTSTFKIRGLSECISGQPGGVTFEMGKIDTNQFPIKKGFLIREMTLKGFLFCVKGVAAFLVSDGKTVVIDTYTDDRGAWEALLLGPVMAALLQQNGFLTLHGSAFLYGEKAVLMLGSSGAGKSSLAMALNQKGHYILTDDICAITFSIDGEPLVYFGNGHVDLWEDSRDALGLPQHTSFQIRQGLPRHRFPLHQPNLNKCYPIGHVYILKVGPLKRLTLNIQRLDFLASVKFLYINLFGRNSLRDMKLEKESFKMIHKIAGQISCTRLIRRQAQMDIKLVSEYLESLLKS